MGQKKVLKKVLCGVAGASGGHIIPGIILLGTLAQQEDADVLFFSTNTQFDRSILEHYLTSFTHCSLPVIPVPGKKVWRYPLFFYHTLSAFFTSLRALRRYRPTKVISMGGFISVPVCLAARVLRIDIQLFELNAVPGKAVRWLAPFARTIFVCFDDAARSFDQNKVQHASYPLRFTDKDMMSQKEARVRLNLSPDKKVILVLGGSQGSQALNALMKRFFETSSEKDLAVIHQTGAVKGSDPQKEFEQFYKERGIEAVVFAYAHELNISYAAADLVISRAGAGSVFELEFFKKKSILIPLEISAEAHQLENALAMIKRSPELFSLARQEYVEKNPAALASLIVKGLNRQKS